jgi:predicted transcriptional regulator
MVYNRRQFRKEILGVLLSKGELSIDLIADEFKNRNDEQVKREIEKLLKDEYVREVEGIYFEITNKGKKFRGVFGEGL